MSADFRHDVLHALPAAVLAGALAAKTEALSAATSVIAPAATIAFIDPRSVITFVRNHWLIAIIIVYFVVALIIQLIVDVTKNWGKLDNVDILRELYEAKKNRLIASGATAKRLFAFYMKSLTRLRRALDKEPDETTYTVTWVDRDRIEYDANDPQRVTTHSVPHWLRTWKTELKKPNPKIDELKSFIAAVESDVEQLGKSNTSKV